MQDLSWCQAEARFAKRTLERRSGSRLARASEPPWSKVLETRDGGVLSREECLLLATAAGDDLFGLVVAANELRQRMVGDDGQLRRDAQHQLHQRLYCRAASSARSRSGRGTRPRISCRLRKWPTRCAKRRRWGATEVCIQGGLPRDLPPFYYRDILRAVKSAVPTMHCHAFSPMEMGYGVELTGMPVREYLLMLKDNGLDTLPGTAAEILDDDVRQVLSRNKLSVAQWCEIIETAHECGIRSTSTMMYGHTETPEQWVNQLLLLREIQSRTGGFTEFVPLGFIHDNTLLFAQGLARAGATLEEHMKVHALARVMLAGSINHIQVSWVKLGREVSQLALLAGRRRLRRHAVRREHLAAGGRRRRAVHFDRRISGTHSRAGPRSGTAQHGVHAVHLSGASWVAGRERTHDRNRWRYGSEGSGLALRWARAGESVIIGSRDAERAQGGGRPDRREGRADGQRRRRGERRRGEDVRHRGTHGSVRRTGRVAEATKAVVPPGNGADRRHGSAGDRRRAAGRRVCWACGRARRRSRRRKSSARTCAVAAAFH